jgi:predicted Zn finger-like uncharacterized protein
MSSADPQTSVIACPNCGTRYQVPRATLGAAGREVQCAQCGKPWHAVADAVPPPPPVPDDDRMFTAAEENALDAAFEMEAEAVDPPAARLPAAPERDPGHERTLADIRAAIAPKPKKPLVGEIDAAKLSKVKRAFADRQAKVTAKLPMARMRRTARIAASIMLVATLAPLLLLRTEAVRAFPSLAGLYAAIGLPVNVVGLEFHDAKTLTSLRGAKKVMTISARIRSVASTTVAVPPVQVSLLDADGNAIYEWTATPQAREIDPGEVFDFSTEVNSPPEGAVKVRLGFSNRIGGSSAPAHSKAL